MFSHSHAIRSGLSGRLRQSHEEHIDHRYNAQYIISAEFNNKVGPIIKHQYPTPIPGFKGRPNSKTGAVNLASLMIPNSIESKLGCADFTIFILYKDKYTRNYQIFPVSESSAPSNTRANLTILEEEEHSESRNSKLLDAKEPPLFFLNVVNTLKDDSNDRGAIIRAIALGTTVRNFLIFKPLLAMTLDLYMRSNDNILLLVDCFNMINSLDLSLAKRVMSNSSLQTLLSSINDESVISEIFNPASHNLPHLLHLNTLPKTDNFGNNISFKRHLIEYQFTKFKPKLLPPAFSRISLQIDMINYDPVKVNINYNDHVLKFLSKFILKLDKLLGLQFSWRLLVNSTKLSKDTLSQFIMTLSNFIKHFDFHYFENAQVVIFPYMDISFIDALKEQLIAHGTRRTFTIVGVSNPIFEWQKDVWDFYYDMDKEDLQCRHLAPPSLATLSNNSQESMKGSKIKNIFSKRASSAMLLSEPPQRYGLTSKMITYLVREQHDNETILNVFKRINILQLLSLLKDLENGSRRESELSLKDEYVVTYRDFIIFPEFFEYGALKLIRCLDQLEQDLNFILFDGKESSQGYELNALERVFASLKQINKFMGSSTANIDKFINIGLNFPLTSVRNGESLSTKDFNEVDLEAFFDDFKVSNSMESLYSHHKGVVDYFAMKRFLRLLFLPLVLDSAIESSADFMDYFDSQATGPGDAGLYPKRLFHSEINSSPMSSWYNESSLFQDNFTDETRSKTISSRNGDSSRDSFSECDYIVPRIKRASIAVIRKLQKHPLGKILIKHKLNPMFKSIYDTLEEDFAAKRKSHNEKRSSLMRPQSSVRDSMNVSPSRMELLKDLTAISQQQENIKLKAATEGRPARASILDTLNRLTSDFNETAS